MRGIIVSFLLFFAWTVSAQVVISEIMYDPKGADAGHEWIEIFNDGQSAVDLLKSKFVEGGSSHGLAAEKGGTTLAPNQYAIIADNAKTFLSDHPNFSGMVLDSSFSLKNGGETVAFKMPDGTISDSVVYSSGMGASEDGNSLQKVDGTWKGGISTPGGGASVAVSPVAPNTASSNSSTNTSVNTSSVNTATFPVEPQIFANAGAPSRIVVVGAPITFSGKVFGLKKEPIENARMLWSFGDGGSALGQTVLHTYYYPGEYTVVLDAASGYYSASDRMRVTVVKPELILRAHGDAVRSFVTVENLGSDEVDLSAWLVAAGNSVFTLPQNTLVEGRKTITLPSEVTKLSTPEGSVVGLRYPNGEEVSLGKKVEPVFVSVSPSASVSRDSVGVVAKNQTPPRNTRKPSSEQFEVKNQGASLVDAGTELSTTSVPASLERKEESLSMWYAGVAFLGAFALLGLRYARRSKESDELSAEDFEIEEEDGGKNKQRKVDF